MAKQGMKGLGGSENPPPGSRNGVDQPSPLVARIDALREALKPPLSRNALCVLAGIDRNVLRLAALRGGNISATSLSKIAAVLKTPAEDLMKYLPTPPEPDYTAPAASTPAPRGALHGDIPIRGTAAGSALGADVLLEADIGYVARPPGLERVPDAYAIYVRNDSMEPMHSQGDLRFVHPWRSPRPGDSIILQVNEQGSTQAYIKILVKKAGGWYICRQLNPPMEVRFAVANVIAAHHVMTTNELFNVT